MPVIAEILFIFVFLEIKLQFRRGLILLFVQAVIVCYCIVTLYLIVGLLEVSRRYLELYSHHGGTHREQ